MQIYEQLHSWYARVLRFLTEFPLFMNLFWLESKCKHENNVSFNSRRAIMRPYSQEVTDTETGKSWEWVSERKKGGRLQELVLHHLPHCLFRDSRLSLLSTLMLRCSYAPSAAVAMTTSPTDLHKTTEGYLFVWSISMTQRHLHLCQPSSQSFWKYDWT